MCHDAAGLSTPGRRGAHCRGHLGDLCLGLERSSLCLNRACDGAVRDHLPHFSRKPSLPRGSTRGGEGGACLKRGWLCAQVLGRGESHGEPSPSSGAWEGR